MRGFVVMATGPPPGAVRQGKPRPRSNGTIKGEHVAASGIGLRTLSKWNTERENKKTNDNK